MGHANAYATPPHRTDVQGGDADLCAYNAAFGELGLRFRWDETTLSTLPPADEERDRIAAYLTQHQAYLLTAYDLGFLSQLIYDKKNQHFRAR
jgi:hypothetical protein